MTPLPDGRWRLRVYLGRDPETGRPRQRERTFRGSRKAARQELAKLGTEARAEQRRTSPTTMTLGQLLDEWLAYIAPQRAPTTMHEYRREVERVIKPALGKRPLAKLTAHDLDRFYAAELAKGLSPSTVRRYHAALSAALHQAERWDWIKQNPARRASPPAQRDYTLKVPTPDQLRTMIESCIDRDPILATAIALAALTGARRGELCALRWSDVDLAGRSLTIARSLTVQDHQFHEGPTKTHQVRRVALDATAMDVLATRWVEQHELSEQAESPLVEDPYVLSLNANGGRPVKPDLLTSRFSVLVRRLGWQFRFHDLRHFSVTTLVAAGIDLRTVAQRHGHAQATMTLNRYAHALPERDREAAAVIGGILALPKRTGESGNEEEED